MFRMIICLFKGHDPHIKQALSIKENGLDVQYLKICSRCGRKIDDGWDMQAYKKVS